MVLYIYDVSDPTCPSLLSYPDYSLNYDDTHSADGIAIDGTYVYSFPLGSYSSS